MVVEPVAHEVDIPSSTDQPTTSGWRRIALLIAITALGAARVIWYVVHDGSNVPTGDDWDLLRTLLAWRTDGIGAASLFAFHNEHRIVMTRLIDGALLPRFDGDLRVILLLDAGFVSITLALLLSFFRRERAHPLFVATTAIATAALVSGWFQWQNLLWSFQLPWLLLPLLLVASLWTIRFVRDGRLAALLLALSLIASLGCQANGVLVWVAVIPALILRFRAMGMSRRRLVAIGCGALFASAAASILYASGAPPWVARPDVAGAIREPFALARFFFAVLGSPFSGAAYFLGPDRWIGPTTGVVALVAALTALAHVARTGWRERASSLFGLALGLMIFGGASALAIAVGRFQHFSFDHIESRYSTFALYFHVGLLLTFFMIAMRARPAGAVTGSLRLALVVGCVALVAGATWGDTILARHGTNLKLALQRVKAVLNVANALPGERDLAGAAHTVPTEQIPALLTALQQHRLWRPTQLGPVLPQDVRFVDEIGNVDAALRSADGVTLEGWARLPNDLPADAVLALAPDPTGRLVPVAISAKERLSRPDVQAKFGADRLDTAGWRLTIDASAASHEPRIAAYSAETDRLYAIPFLWNAVH